MDSQHAKQPRSANMNRKTKRKHDTEDDQAASSAWSSAGRSIAEPQRQHDGLVRARVVVAAAAPFVAMIDDGPVAEDLSRDAEAGVLPGPVAQLPVAHAHAVALCQRSLSLFRAATALGHRAVLDGKVGRAGDLLCACSWLPPARREIGKLFG